MNSYKFRQVLKENIGINNPVFVQILGICSTLAVTNVLRNTVVMCAGLVFVTGLSNLTVSLLRQYIPGRVRMMVETLIIAFLRELLGTGSIWGVRVLGEWWINWNIMIMAPGAFFMLALFIWVVKGNFMKEKKAQGSASTPAPQAASTGGKS